MHLRCLGTIRSSRLLKKMIIYSVLAVACFTSGLLACSLPPYTRFYSVTERTILAPIVIQARVVSTTRSDSSIQSKYKACVRKEKVIKGSNVPESFCLGTFGPDFLCLVDVRPGSSYIFFINEDYTARYDGFPAAVAQVSEIVVQAAERGYCNPYRVADERKCGEYCFAGSSRRYFVYAILLVYKNFLLYEVAIGEAEKRPQRQYLLRT